VIAGSREAPVWGLSIVQRIAELHSATIALENRYPTGARFSLRFMPFRI
jgi:signal transduction histidine kinase